MINLLTTLVLLLRRIEQRLLLEIARRTTPKPAPRAPEVPPPTARYSGTPDPAIANAFAKAFGGAR